MKKWLSGAALTAALAACNAAPTAPVVAISPVNPKTDAELKATLVTPSTDPNGDPVAVTFEWLKNNEKQAGLTTDTVPADKTAKGDVWTVIATPSDGILPGPAGQASATIQNSAPTVTAVFEPATPSKNGDLKIVPTATDADGDKVTFTYAWTKDGTSTNLVTDTVPAAQLARGQKWQVTVTPNDGAENGQAFNLSVDVANAKPVAPGVTLAPEKPTKATPIIASAQPGTDADGDAVQLKFAWMVDGKIVDGQTGAVLAPTFFAKNNAVTVIVTPNDGKEDGTPATATISVANTAPTVPAVSVNARPKDSDEIVCTLANPSLDIDGDVIAYVFTWLKNEQPFNNATSVGNTSTVSAGDTAEGDTYSCSARATDGFDTSAASNNAQARVNAKPVLASVALSPLQPTKATPIYAQPANPSDADGDTVLLKYQWLVAGNPVQGQTSSALVPTFFAKGQDVTVIVTPNDGIEDGTPALANVNVQNSAPTAPGVTITASPRTTDSIVCSVVAPSSDLDGDTLTYAFTWTKNGQPFNNAATTGANSVVAAPHANGDRYSCTVAASDGANSAQAEVRSTRVGCRFARFNGSNSKVRIGALPILAGNGPRTFGGWMRQRVSSALLMNLTTFGSGRSRNSRNSLLVAPGGVVVLVGESNDFGSSGANYDVGRWTHMMATHDGSTARLFVDGVQVASSARTYATNWSLPLMVGTNSEDRADEWFDGDLADLRFWARALSAAEIQAERASRTPVSANALVGWWPLDDGPLAFRDASGNGRDGVGSNITDFADGSCPVP
jgi:hypothetical protein